MSKKFLFFTSIADNFSLTCSLSSRIIISDGKDLEIMSKCKEHCSIVRKRLFKNLGVVEN